MVGAVVPVVHTKLPSFVLHFCRNFCQSHGLSVAHHVLPWDLRPPDCHRAVPCVPLRVLVQGIRQLRGAFIHPPSPPVVPTHQLHLGLLPAQPLHRASIPLPTPRQTRRLAPLLTPPIPCSSPQQPEICKPGTYRSLADSVSCRRCPQGTWTPYEGVQDISGCEPCPPGRVCGLEEMDNLTKSSACPR